MRLSSLRARLLLWAGGLTGLALAAAWFALSAVLEDFVASRLAAEQMAVARGVMAGAEWQADGRLLLDAEPSDTRFDAPLSGWYWQVADGTRVLLRSASLVTGDLGRDGTLATGPDGAMLRLQTARFTAPGDGRALIVTVSLPVAELRRELDSVRQPLVVTLLILGGALLLAQGLAVRAGLAGLTRFTRNVAQLRDGRISRVDPPSLSELQPLAHELDRLIATNRAQVERARAHAGDLAHAMKTPLAVLSNRATPEDAALFARMDQLVNWHLKRARAAGASLDPLVRTPVGPVLQDIALVSGPEARRRGITLKIADQVAPDFRGDAEDLFEMVGNLVENAVKWATATVTVAATGDAGRLVITVEDDGPGIPASQRAALLKRGARLDEAMPGHGLGLAIVQDRAALYDGALTLETGGNGGLSARLNLPAAT